jgi:hypothetical protein
MNRPRHSGVIRHNHDIIDQRAIRIQSTAKFAGRVNSPISILDQENNRPKIGIIHRLKEKEA